MSTFTIRLEKRPGASEEATPEHLQNLLARMAAAFCVAHQASGEPDPAAAEVGEMLRTFTTPETIEEFLAQARMTLGQAAHLIGR